jgi:hypothetical protein
VKIQQLSLFAENKPGHIAAPIRLLAQEGIDIRSLYLADTQQYGILRMIVSDWEKAAAILQSQGFTVKVTEVLAVEVSRDPHFPLLRSGCGDCALAVGRCESTAQR